MNGATFVVAMRLEGWAFGGDVFRCGVGPRRAARRTRRWLHETRPAAVVNVGICGGMHPDLGVGELVLVDGWAGGPDADAGLLDELGAHLTRGGLPFSTGAALTVKLPLIRPVDKERGFQRSGAAVCEMEGLALAEVCGDAGVPFAALRAVSDDRNTVLRRPPRMATSLTRSLVALRRAGAVLRP